VNPIVGVIYHWLGGLASGSFYVPFRFVKRWSWETSWLAAGVFSWIIAPWVFATLNTTDPVTVLKETPGTVWFYSYLFGALWGIGGLTFGLAMRYLGMSLGMAVALGYCTVFGTLIPPIFKGEFKAKLLDDVSGRWILAGLAVCVIGIIVTALAGKAKEGEMTEAQKRDTVKEFSFKKGIIVATFSGIMSACFAFGLTAGDWIRATTYNVDMAHSAKAMGKEIVRSSEPAGAESAAFISSLGTAPLFKEGSVGSVGSVLGLLEEPFSLATKIAAFKAKPTLLPADTKVLTETEAKLPEALNAAQAARVAVSNSTDPIAKRISTYAAKLPSIAADAKTFAVVDGLSFLSEKETALSISATGVDFMALHSKHSLWTGLPVLIVVLLGGFTTNFIWCLLLNLKNKTGYQYFSSKAGKQSPLTNPLIAAGEGSSFDGRKDPAGVPLISNYVFAALAGTLWYFQFFFYSMGETQMGDYKFSSWTLHMASIIIFSSIWGLALREWKGASAKSKGLLFGGLAILVLSTVIIGYGNYVGSH
jgi:L-rhamnose-proton symport protein (RhaT)